jgi:hypothetical protein
MVGEGHVIAEQVGQDLGHSGRIARRVTKVGVEWVR